jgi:hypothetical protein
MKGRLRNIAGEGYKNANQNSKSADTMKIIAFSVSAGSLAYRRKACRNGFRNRALHPCPVSAVDRAEVLRKTTAKITECRSRRQDAYFEWSDLQVVLAVARGTTLLASALTAVRVGEPVIDAAERVEHQILLIQERMSNQDSFTAGTVRYRSPTIPSPGHVPTEKPPPGTIS